MSMFNSVVDKVINVLSKYETKKVTKVHSPDTRGQKNGRSILLSWQVASIRRMHYAGGMTQQQLGDTFCISRQTIGDIVNMKTWKHVK